MGLYGLNIPAESPWKKKVLDVHALDFSKLNHIGSASDYEPGSSLWDGQNATSERRKRRK